MTTKNGPGNTQALVFFHGKNRKNFEKWDKNGTETKTRDKKEEVKNEWKAFDKALRPSLKQNKKLAEPLPRQGSALPAELSTHTKFVQ